MAKSSGPTILKSRSIAEIIERGENDPVLFARDFFDFECHETQAAWLRRSGDPHIPPELRVAKPGAKQACFHAANRVGKTQSTGIRLLHSAYYQVRDDKYAYDSGGRRKPYVAVNVALSLDQAMIAWNYALALAQDSPRFKEFVIDVQGTPFPRLVIGNSETGNNRIRSEIWARSTAKGARFLLGKTFNFLSWDECAFEPDGKEILDGVIRMRLVDQSGDLELISSPNGKNWFYEECLLGRDQLDARGEVISNPHYYSQRGVTFDNPHIDHEAVRRSMEVMSEDQRKQNIYGEFADTSSIFDTVSVQACMRGQDYAHLMGENGLPPDSEWSLFETDDGLGYRLTHNHSKHSRYVMGVDLGRKRDQTCIVVLRVPENKAEPAQMVFYQLLPVGMKWEKQFDRISEVYYRYHACPTLIDSTSVGGDVILEQLQNKGLNVSGYNLAGGVEKENLLFHLQAAIQEQRVRFPFIKSLNDSLIYYQWKDKNLFTDPVFGLAFAWECALNNGMGEPVEPYVLLSPDLPIITVSSDFTGRTQIRGFSDCPCCNSSCMEVIDEFCKKGYVRAGEMITTEQGLIEFLAMKEPKLRITTDHLKNHRRHLLNEPDEDDEFEQLFNQKYAAQLIM